MVIPFPSQRHRQAIQTQTYKIQTDKFVSDGLYPGDEVTVAPGESVREGDWVLVETGGRLMLRRYDRFCERLRICGRLRSLMRVF